MREIKFRAWDSCNERMVEPRNILKINMSRLNQEPYLIVYLRKWMNPVREIKEVDKCYTNEFELMQYTGLKDKNGKEIYQGDIVKTLYKVGQVKWCNKQGRYNVYLKNQYGVNEMSFTENMANACELLGNIYENSELI